MQDLLPMRRMLNEVTQNLGMELLGTQMHSTVFEDNNGALTLTNLPSMTPWSKHIAVKYHFFRESIKDGNVKIMRVKSENQKADIFTKGITVNKFPMIRRLLLGW